LHSATYLIFFLENPPCAFSCNFFSNFFFMFLVIIINKLQQQTT
jgi:hypothetical protein